MGLATGHLAEGVTASAGALIVGFANLGGSYRIRGETLLATTLAAGAGALLGGFAGPSVVGTVVLIGVWGFAGGLLVSLGRRAAFVGLLSTWALLLAGDLHLHGDAVVREAWLITAGGLVQTVVAIAAWPLRPFAAERQAIADAYRALAAYARAPATATLQSTAGALAAAADTVGAGAPVGSDPEAPNERTALRALVEEGEWVRVELAALAQSDVPGVEATLRAAAGALDAIAMQRGRAFSLAALERSAQTVTEPVARGRAASLVAWIAAAAGGEDDGVAPSPAARRHPIRALRAELTLRSAAFRHAARLSGALIVAVLAYRSLSLGSGYWVPLTVLFVLKPDYGTTVARGIGRIAGTMAGVTIAWAVVTSFSPSDATIVALLAVLAAATYALFPANYALSSIVLTVLIALLVEFSGGSPVGALLDRVIDTAVGGAIALSAVALWPTPEAPQTRECLAALVTAHEHWLDAILRAFSDGDERRSLRSTRLATRRARAQARESVQRALAEPPRRRPDTRPLHDLLAAMDEISECALVLAAAVHDGTRAPRETLTPYRNALSDSFENIAASLRDDAWATPPLPREETFALLKDDPAVATVATEALTVLAVLERLDRTRRGSTSPSHQ
ncbi:MAG: FUSC family protein [Solirubrobacteraceae bacterium]